MNRASAHCQVLIRVIMLYFPGAVISMSFLVDFFFFVPFSEIYSDLVVVYSDLFRCGW